MTSCRFHTFEAFHGKQNIGSTNIRVHQLLKYWPEAGIYKFGENPDVLIFQKVYVTPDYRFPEHYHGKKILDICDADWLNGMTGIKETIDSMDAVTCPTETLAAFLRQLTDKPVVVIPDRYDLELFPEPRKHTAPAQTVAWFGYRHNAELLRPAMGLINDLNLNLLVIADDDPMAWQWLNNRQESSDFREKRYRYTKYSADQAEFHRNLQEADFAVLPEGNRPVDYFKSNNKTTRSILCGLPVAKTAEDMRALVFEDGRRSYLKEHYEATREEYDCKKSVDQYKELLCELEEKALIYNTAPEYRKLLIWLPERKLDLSMTLIVAVKLDDGYLVASDGNSQLYMDLKGSTKFDMATEQKIFKVGRNVAFGVAGELDKKVLPWFTEAVERVFGDQVIDDLEAHRKPLERLVKMAFDIRATVLFINHDSLLWLPGKVELPPVQFMGERTPAVTKFMDENRDKTFSKPEAVTVLKKLFEDVHAENSKIGGKVVMWSVKRDSTKLDGELVDLS